MAIKRFVIFFILPYILLLMPAYGLNMVRLAFDSHHCQFTI
jgi:hypothetical protein